MTARLQLALNVSDLDAAIGFYSDLFAAVPHKVRAGYANFAIAEPPLKLVLIEKADAPGGSVNHLGVEVASPEEVVAATERLRDAGLDPQVREAQLCCHAVQDKAWVHGADGEAWEVYTIADDEPVFTADRAPDRQQEACCVGSTAAGC